jgi:hypothetical protein
MTKLIVPFKRPLYPPSFSGEKTLPGDDILSVKRMVSRAGFWPWGEFDPVYHEGFAKGQRNRLGRLIKGREGMVGLQKLLGVKRTGYYGNPTHTGSLPLRVPKGLPHYRELIWDQFAINNYKGYEDLSPAEEIVKEIFHWWNYLVDREPSVHYDQKPPRMPISDDCSGTLIGCAWLAGARSPDPWYQYNGAGNTGSLVNGGIRISESEIDNWCKTHYVAAFYGNSVWSTKHVVAVENSKKFYSHGRESGPEIIRGSLHYHTYPLIAIRAYPVI